MVSQELGLGNVAKNEPHDTALGRCHTHLVPDQLLCLCDRAPELLEVAAPGEKHAQAQDHPWHGETTSTNSA